jgi:hypothetical protein
VEWVFKAYNFCMFSCYGNCYALRVYWHMCFVSSLESYVCISEVFTLHDGFFGGVLVCTSFLFANGGLYGLTIQDSFGRLNSQW